MTNSSDQTPLDTPNNHPLDVQMMHITPELATEWLGANHDNRNKRPGHIRAIARDMADGNWRVTGDAIRFDWTGRLIDGQHRLEAVILSGVTIGSLVIRGLEPNAREVIDTNARRSPADALRFQGYTNNPLQLAAVARLALGRSQGLLTNALSGDPSSYTNSEVVEWADAHPEVEHAIALARRTFKSIGISPAVWGYCLWEFQKCDGARAVEFATSTADRRTTGKGDPRYALLDVYMRAATGRRRKPTNAESIYLCFRAWNAWVNGTTTAPFIAVGRDGSGNAIPRLEGAPRVRKDA